MFSISNAGLTKLVNKINVKYFGETVKCPIAYNGRLRTTLGRYLLIADPAKKREFKADRKQTKRELTTAIMVERDMARAERIKNLFNNSLIHFNVKYSKLEINPNLITKHYYKNTRRALINVIKHELCHYNLHKRGMRSGHNAFFYRMANEIGCPATRLAPPARNVRRRHRDFSVYRYQCTKCGREWVLPHMVRNRMHATDHGKLKYIGKVPMSVIRGFLKKHANQ